MTDATAPTETPTPSAGTVKLDRMGSKGSSGKVSLYDPFALTIPEIDGPILGLDDAEATRIAALPAWEQPAALAPYRIAGLKAEFEGNALALALIDAVLDDRATQPLSPEFVLSCEGGVTEPLIGTCIGSRRDGSACVLIVEGRQRDRTERYHAGERASEGLPPRSLPVVLRTFTSARKAREIKVATAAHVALSPLQRAERYQEFVADGVAPIDAAHIVGWKNERIARSGLEILKRDTSVKDAVASGAMTAQTAKELRHLSQGEQRQRVEAIAATGARGRRARQIARGEQTTDEQSKAPTRTILDSLAKRLAGSSDPILLICGSLLAWSTTGADTGLDRVPGLRALVDEEQIKAHGLRLDAADMERLRQRVDALGGVEAAAGKMGIHKQSVMRAMSGLRVKTRVRAALLAACATEPSKAA